MDRTIKATKRVSAALQVVESINGALRDGTLQEGDRLPCEQDLAEMLDVGRSSLREGVRILAANGVLDVRQGEGTFVTDKFAEKVFEFLGYPPVPENYPYLLELREVLEYGCVSLICGKLSADDLDELERLSLSLDAAAPTADNIANDMAFHSKLFSLSNNELIYQMYRMMFKTLSSLMCSLMGDPDVVRDAREAHLRIVAALHSGDVAASIAAVKTHLDRVSDYAGLSRLK